MSEMNRNGCPKWIGITVRNESEWVSGMRRNTHPGIDPAIVARAIRGKIYPTDIIFGHIIANPDGIDINTLAKKTGFKNEQIKQIILSLRQEGIIRSKPKEGLRGKAYAAGISRSLYFEA